MNILRTHRLITFLRKYVRVLRLAAWNALLVISGLMLIALGGEGYLRLINPFIETQIPFRFVDGVGVTREPNAEIRYANWHDDNFVASRTNNLGFLDREPVSPGRAAAGCHIAFIGDSYVESMEVPIADKFHVRLEEMAERELPHLGVTTQAYGIVGTGQISQLPFYDEYARLLKPKVVMLVFYLNDFANNSTELESIRSGVDPDRMPYMSAQRDADGAMKLRPPHPEYKRFLLPRTPQRWHGRLWGRLIGVSYFAKWLDTKNPIMGDDRLIPVEWVDRIAGAHAPDVWQPGLEWTELAHTFLEEHLPPIYEDSLEYTAFGMEQFKRRADRDGVSLAIMAATQDMGLRGDPQFDRLNVIAEAYDIPIISQYDYIISQGHADSDGRGSYDRHWNAAGHQWAAEAILEWLKENQDVCD